MSRTLSYPIIAAAVVVLCAVANGAVYLAGEQWFVLRPSIQVVIRNVAIVAAMVGIIPILLGRERRSRAGLTLLVTAGALVGVGSAMQFRLGHDVPRRLTPAETSHIFDSVRASLPGVGDDSVRRAAAIAVRSINRRMRVDFEASRIDVRLARSLDRTYGPTPVSQEVLGARRSAPADNALLRFVPLVAALLVVIAGTRRDLVAFLSHRWVMIGVWGSLGIALLSWIYLASAGGIRGASFAPQELLKITLPIAWGGLLVRYHDALIPDRRERFTKSPFALWLYILALLSAPLASFVLARDFGQFLVIGIGQVMVLAWYTRSPLYVVLFSAAFVASGIVLLSTMLPTGVTVAGALGVVAGAVVVLGWLERFRRRDVLWTSASFVLAAYLVLAGIVARLPFMAGALATPRARFALFADLYGRHGDRSWWDRTRQVIEALYAQDAGGMMGSGLGRGTPFLIPNANSDYIFSAIVEELGVTGGMFVIVAYAAMVAIGLRIASDLGRESFRSLVVASMTILLGSQALIHIAGNLNVLPMTGITLPLVSTGGSSMVVVMVMVALVVTMAGDAGRPRLVIRA